MEEHSLERCDTPKIELVYSDETDVTFQTSADADADADVRVSTSADADADVYYRLI